MGSGFINSGYSPRNRWLTQKTLKSKVFGYKPVLSCRPCWHPRAWWRGKPWQAARSMPLHWGWAVFGRIYLWLSSQDSSESGAALSVYTSAAVWVRSVLLNQIRQLSSLTHLCDELWFVPWSSLRAHKLGSPDIKSSKKMSCSMLSITQPTRVY